MEQHGHSNVNNNNNNNHNANETPPINLNSVTLNSSQQKNRLAFYKPPQQKTNIYQFSKQDIERSQVVQQRFKQLSLVSNSNCSNQVTEGGRAETAGIKLGDSVVKINEQSTRNMSLDEAKQQLQSSENQLKLNVKK